MRWQPTVGMLFGCLIAVASSVSFETRALPRGVLLDRMLDEIDRRYVEPVDVDRLFRSGVDEIVRGLDRNSQYIPPDEVDAFDGETEGFFVGIGVVLTAREEDYPIVESVIRGGPADKAGVRAGDAILRVDRDSVHGISLGDLIARIRGMAGSTVSLQIRRGAGAPATVLITLERIDVTSVGAVRLYDGEPAAAGYLRIHQFQVDTAEEARTAIDSLRAEGARSLILDLRSNPGGVLDEGVELARLFLRDGVLLSTEGRSVEARTYRVEEPGRFLALPLVVLIDGDSASASEFVAAALQDHRRALLVGAESYGKWTVQTILRLGEDHLDGRLKLTTSRFHRPDPGAVYIDATGTMRVRPDVVVECDAGVRETLAVEWRAESMHNINSPLLPVRQPRPTYQNATGDGESAPVVDAVLVRALGILSEPGVYDKLLEARPARTGSGSPARVSPRVRDGSAAPSPEVKEHRP